MRMSLKRPLRRTDRVTFRRKSNPVRPASFCRLSEGAAACCAHSPSAYGGQLPRLRAGKCFLRRTSPGGPAPAPAGQFILCRPGKRIGPDPRLYPKGISAPARQAWARARTLPGLFDKLWGRPAHFRTPPLFPVRCMVFPKNCPLTSTYVRYIIIVHQFEFEGRIPGGTAG